MHPARVEPHWAYRVFLCLVALLILHLSSGYLLPFFGALPFLVYLRLGGSDAGFGFLCVGVAITSAIRQRYPP